MPVSNKKRSKQYPEPIVVGLRKAEIYNRRGPRVYTPSTGFFVDGLEADVSSLEEAHSLLKEADPSLESTLELKRNKITAT